MTRYIKFLDVNNSLITVGQTAVNLEDALKPDGNIKRMLQSDLVEVYSSKKMNCFWNGNTPTQALGFPIAAKNITTITGANPKDVTFICTEEGDSDVIVVVGHTALGFPS